MDKQLTIEELGKLVSKTALEFEAAVEAKREADRRRAAAGNALEEAKCKLDKARNDLNNHLEKLYPTPKMYPLA